MSLKPPISPTNSLLTLASVEANTPFVNLRKHLTEGVVSQAGWNAAVAATPEGGTLFIPEGDWRVPIPVCEKRIDIIGEGVGSCITISAGAGVDGFTYGPDTETAIYGATLKDFAIIGGASAARYALVLRRLIECTIEDVYIKAGADWHASLEGLLVCKVRLRTPGNNYNLPLTATRATNGVRVVGSAGAGTNYPSNANDLDLTIQAITGDGLVVDATIGEAGSFNNEIRGTYQGITGKPIYIKGANHWKIAHTHVEASGTLTIENCAHASLGRGVYAGVAVSLIGSDDIELDGVALNQLTLDANSDRTKLGRITYNLLGTGGITDNGSGTTADGRLVDASGANKSRGLPGPPEGLNLLPSDGLRRWDTTPKPINTTISPGTITKTGDGQGDTDRLFPPFAGLMSGASATYFENVLSGIELEEAKGRYVTLGAWVKIASGQANQPNIVIEANIPGGLGTQTGQAASTADAWELLTITVPVAAAATGCNLKLRNTVALTGDWRIGDTWCVIGRAGSRTQPSRVPRRLYAEATWDPASLVAGAVASVNVTVQGCAIGDFAVAAFESTLGNSQIISARVVAANTVQVTLRNDDSVTRDHASSTLRVETWKH